MPQYFPGQPALVRINSGWNPAPQSPTAPGIAPPAPPQPHVLPLLTSEAPHRATRPPLSTAPGSRASLQSLRWHQSGPDSAPALAEILAPLPQNGGGRIAPWPSRSSARPSPPREEPHRGASPRLHKVSAEINTPR